MRENQAQKAARLKTILEKLKRYYPGAHCALNFKNPLELLVATILSAQCTDDRVNIVTKDLFKKFRKAGDYAAASLPSIEKIIRSTGFFRAKAKSLKGMGQGLVNDYGGEVPQELEQLIQLPGVGRKTANVVMGNAFHKAVGVVVDTHVKRLSFRMGLTTALSPEQVEQDLIKLVPETDWIMFPHWLITHGRQICKARKPACERCFLEGDCPKLGVKG